MPSDPIDTLTASTEARIARDVLAAFKSYVDSIDPLQLIAILDNIEDDHTREQLEAFFELEGAVEPAPLGDVLAGVILALASFAGAVAALAGAQARHIVNPGHRHVAALRANAGGFLARFMADSGDGIRHAIDRALASPGSTTRRASLLRQSIGLGARQVASLQVMHDALMSFVYAPIRRVPGCTDAIGVRQPGATVRRVDTNTILASTRGSISGAQRNVLKKALGNPRLTEADAITILDRHAAALRGFRIRSLVGEGVHALAETSKLTGWQIAQAFGALPADQRRFWRTAGDERVRHSHAMVPGMNPQGVGLTEPFKTPFGPTMTPPLEPGCRCRVTIRTKA